MCISLVGDPWVGHMHGGGGVLGASDFSSLLLLGLDSQWGAEDGAGDHGKFLYYTVNDIMISRDIYCTL